jgi:hypothetical protein
MFGEYMVYVNDKPILLVCDNTVYVKKLDCLAEIMPGAETGFPYSGAKEHYLLDIEDPDLSGEVCVSSGLLLSRSRRKTGKIIPEETTRAFSPHRFKHQKNAVFCKLIGLLPDPEKDAAGWASEPPRAVFLAISVLQPRVRFFHGFMVACNRIFC